MEEDIDKLISLVKKKKLTKGYFDDFVHQTASNVARGIIDKGLRTQFEFLLRTHWTPKDIKDVMP